MLLKRSYNIISNNIIIVLLIIILSTTFNIVSPAKSSSTINYIRIERIYKSQEGIIVPDDMELVPGNKHYQIQVDLQYNSPDVKLGMTLPIKLTLTANDGYTFKGLKVGSCLSDYGSLSNLKISADKKTARLDFTADPLPMKLTTPNILKWDEMAATWSKVAYADSYEVKIYVISNKGAINLPKKTLKTQDTSIDCSSILLSSPGDYVFTVTAIPDVKKKYLNESEIAIQKFDDSLLLSSDLIGYYKGYWRTRKGAQQYIFEGSPLSDGIYKINGHFYYFDSLGNVKVGWLQINGKQYYSNDSGKMLIGWFEAGNSKYYFQEDGSMATGWVHINNNWYYFSTNGAMKTGWIKYEEKIYYLNLDGTMRTQKMVDKTGKVYNFKQDGALIK
jgi:glucan-binding YG repeat protein